MQVQELDPVILEGPFQHSLFCDSVISQILVIFVRKP